MSKLADLQLGLVRLKPFTFKRKKNDGTDVDVHVDIRALTKREMDLARVNARAALERLAPNMKEGSSYEELLEDTRIVEILAIACRKPGEPDATWATPLEIEAILTTAEIGSLWKVYVEHQAESSPTISDLSKEEYETILETIAKEGSADPLLLFASPLRNAFTITLVRELVTLRMVSSSSSSASTAPSGQPSNGGTSSSESEDPTQSAGDLALDRSASNTAEIAVLRELFAELVVRVGKLEGAPGTGPLESAESADEWAEKQRDSLDKIDPTSKA